MLQVVPYLLLFLRKYRMFIAEKYRPYHGFIFILPLVFVSKEAFIKILIYYSVIVMVDFSGLWQLNFFLFWLPVEFNLIPANVGGGEFAGYFTVLSLLSHYLARDGEVDFSLKNKDWRKILKVYLFLALILIPAGLVTGFLRFHPDFSVSRTISFPAIFFAVGYPEELLFRVFLFKTLRSYLKNPAILIVSSVIFGLAHLNGPNGGILYFAFATIAGFGYGYVYLRTRRVASAAYLHTLVDYTWVLLFGG